MGEMSNFTIDSWHVGYGTTNIGGDGLIAETLIWLAITAVVLLYVYPRNRPAGLLVFVGMGVALFTIGESSALVITSAYAIFAIAFVMLVETAMTMFKKNTEDKKRFKGWQ